MNFSASNSWSDESNNIAFENEAQPRFRSVSVTSAPNFVNTRKIGFRETMSCRSSMIDKNIFNKYKNSTDEEDIGSGINKLRWVVNRPSPIPLFGLSQCSVVIQHSTAAVVAARIDDSLRKRSVEARFDSRKAEAFCKTMSFVEYRISLFDSDDGNSTHVEVTRIDGCGFAFSREREAIINAANGLGVVPSSHPKLMAMPAELMSKYTPPSRNELENTLLRTSEYLNSNRQNCVLFALENLAAITNASKLNREAAYLMSELVMENTYDIRDLIIAICVAQRQNCYQSSASLRIHQLCLTIIMHGLQYVLAKNVNGFFLDQTNEQFAEVLIPLLIKDIEGCERSGNNAYVALQCLHLVLKSSSAAYQYSRQYNLRDVILQAEQYGSREYLNLEKAAKMTIDVLA